MRLTEWRTDAPARDALAQKVLAVLEPVLGALGAERDPHAWIAWGDDPGIRYTVLVPTGAGLIVCHVRVNVPGEGPRASAKLVRWSRVQLGELAVETQGGHRLVSFQVEGQVLRGADESADRVAAFAIALLAGSDGRPMPDLEGPRGRRATRSPAKASTAKPARGGASAGAAATTAGTATKGRRSTAVKALPAPRPSRG
jgi:hypothetical protein